MSPYRLFRRIAGMAKRERIARELGEELAFHREMKRQELLGSGIPEDLADRAARRLMGNETHARESARAVWTLSWLDATVRHARGAFRVLYRQPAFSLAVIVTFALGIGAVTAIFAIVNSVLLRPLPYPNADRLVEVHQIILSRSPESDEMMPFRAGLTGQQLEGVRGGLLTLRHLAIYGGRSMTLGAPGAPSRINVALVSSGFIEAFGTAPLIGRTFRPEDEQVGRDEVAMLSERTWSTRFGRDPTALGQTITLNDHPYRVVGVLPASFNQPDVARATLRTSDGRLDDSVGIWIPQRRAAVTPPGAGFTMWSAVATLAAGATPEQAAAELYSAMPEQPLADAVRVEISPWLSSALKPIARVLLVFQAAVGLVLLIACVNVANLSVTRAMRRRRELGVRLALGAGRLDIWLESLVECLTLASIGSALGLLMAFAGVTLVRSLPPGAIPRLAEVRVGVDGLLFAASVSVAAALAVALFVVVRVLAFDPAQLIGRPSATLGLRGRASSVLMAGQLAAAMVLLVCGALLVRSFVSLAGENRGFDTTDTLALRLALPLDRYNEPARELAFYDSLRDALTGIHGVDRVAIGSSLPHWTPPAIVGGPISIDGRPTDGNVVLSIVSPGYFHALGIPMIEGREFTDDDAGRPLALVDEGFVKRFLDSWQPLGHRLQLMNGTTAEIIGVVPAPPRYALETARRVSGQQHSATFVHGEVYVSYLAPATSGFRLTTAVVAIRTTGGADRLVPQIRRAVSQLDRTVPVYSVAMIDDEIGESLAASRCYAIASGALAIVAMLLASVGVYGVVAYSVSARTSELALRMALGASRAATLRTVVRQSAPPLVSGIALGVLGSWAAARGLQGLLFGVQPHDPWVLACVTTLMCGVALIAVLIPSCRATAIDPAPVLSAP